MSDAYEAPAQGWVCFHCGEHLTTYGAARDHFGFDPACDPACRIKAGGEKGLLTALRDAEQDAAKAWDALHSECGDAVKAMHQMVARHREQLFEAEQAGLDAAVAEFAAEITRLRADLAASQRERDEARELLSLFTQQANKESALKRASEAERALAAAQEREQRMREALLGVLNFMENTESELGIKLDSAERARAALGEPQWLTPRRR